MTILFSHYGFPVSAPGVSPEGPSGGTVFQSPEVRRIAVHRRRQVRPDFCEELDQVKTLAKVWEATGGFFKTISLAKNQVSYNVQSFVLETALILTGKLSRRRIGFADWELMLAPTPASPMPAKPLEGASLETVSQLADLPTEVLFQRWISVLGIDDLSESIQLYVGEVPLR